MAVILITAPDNPEGTLYTVAPDEIVNAINRRFDGRRPVVLCPNSADCFIYDPGNFWDGPTHIRFDGSQFWFESWGGPQHFPLIGPIN